jgi:hypothetical protein
MNTYRLELRWHIEKARLFRTRLPGRVVGYLFLAPSERLNTKKTTHFQKLNFAHRKKIPYTYIPNYYQCITTRFFVIKYNAAVMTRNLGTIELNLDD